MKKSIKSKILKKGKKHWWGDDFDSRFLLISKIKHLDKKENKNIYYVSLDGAVTLDFFNNSGIIKPVVLPIFESSIC